MQFTAAQGCVITRVCCPCCLHFQSHQRHQPASRPTRSFNSAQVLQRLRVTAQNRSQYETVSSSERYSAKPVSSSKQAVSFNQQLLIVLAIPAAALGIPFILSHPIICIALPLLVVYTPGLRAIAAPLAAQLLQLILSGLRPSGSPRSDTFPWQQANANAWSSPPIDVDYRALPQIRHEQSQPGAASSDRDTEQQQWQDQSDIGSNSTRHRQQQELYRPDLLRSTRGGTFKQEQEVSQRPTSAVRSRLRTKVNIRPADKANMGSSRMVRQAQPGQVGVNLNTDAVQETRSNLVRALLVVFPFLRDWGGFL